MSTRAMTEKFKVMFKKLGAGELFDGSRCNDRGDILLRMCEVCKAPKLRHPELCDMSQETSVTWNNEIYQELQSWIIREYPEEVKEVDFLLKARFNKLNKENAAGLVDGEEITNALGTMVKQMLEANSEDRKHMVKSMETLAQSMTGIRQPLQPNQHQEQGQKTKRNDEGIKWAKGESFDKRTTDGWLKFTKREKEEQYLEILVRALKESENKDVADYVLNHLVDREDIKEPEHIMERLKERFGKSQEDWWMEFIERIQKFEWKQDQTAAQNFEQLERLRLTSEKINLKENVDTLFMKLIIKKWTERKDQ